jgi:hypothetical protein
MKLVLKPANILLLNQAKLFIQDGLVTSLDPTFFDSGQLPNTLFDARDVECFGLGKF